MPERIYKLQPDRTLALRGFDDLGAAAALHSATSNSFKVSGIFRDAADFAVLILYDADNFYEHPRIKYLPDFEFDGLTLEFDVHYSGLIPLDSTKYPTIDWAFLDVITESGDKEQIRLYDADPAKTRAVVQSGQRTYAECSFTVEDNGLKEFDRLTLWYQNLWFDYVVDKVECVFAFEGKGAGTLHTVTVAGVPYSYLEQTGDTNTSVALGVIASLASCPEVRATQDSGAANQVLLRAKRDDGVGFVVSSSSSTTNFTLYGVGANTVARKLADAINNANWPIINAEIPLQAEVSGPVIRIIAQRPGEDGNMLSMYSLSKNEQLRTTEETVAFSGGTSDVTWHVKLDLSKIALELEKPGLTRIRLMWLTFAPKIANAAPYLDTEWEAVFSNWTVSGPEDRRRLKVAAPGSVRTEESAPECVYSGDWKIESTDKQETGHLGPNETKPGSGFYSGGFAMRASKPGDSVTVKYTCPAAHDLYLGTSLYNDRGAVAIRLDGTHVKDINCFLDNEPAVSTRRLIRENVPAGTHTVVIAVVTEGKPFVFDFLEAAITGDVPDALPPGAEISPALDYSTDHTYKLSPARLMWIFDKLGFTAPMNEYMGVFWWNQRRRVGAVMPQSQVTFSGSFADGDTVKLVFGVDEPEAPALRLAKTVFPGETPAGIARHFKQYINGQSVAAWAEANANVLTITARSAKPAYLVQLDKELSPGSQGQVEINGSLSNGDTGIWEVDPSQTPALNRGARDWHRNLFHECAQRNREIVVACSMELVHPPGGFGAVFLDNEVVETDIGFGQLKSTHCAFVPPMLDYQKAVYTAIADLMAQSGMTPNLQFGEFLWWFFTNRNPENPDGGMAYYDEYTKAVAQAALGRPLTAFFAPTDDPDVNGGADAQFLQARLRDYVAALASHIRAQYPNARIELLFPYDVNHPQPAGVHNLGGRLNRTVNLPVEWEQKDTSPFDRLKMEALDFGAWSRDLDLATTAIRFPLDLGWPKDSIRHLVPIFRGGYPWNKEVELALRAGIPVVNLWAFDHVCLYGMAMNETKGRSLFMG